MQNGSHTHPHPFSSTTSMWISNHHFTTQKIIHVGELLAIPFPAWASCLGHSKVQVQDCLMTLPPFVTDAGEHTISCNIIPCFVVPSILHIPGPARTSSDLWRQRFSFRKKRTGQRQLSLSCFSTTCPCHDPALQAPTLAEQSTPACWSQTLTVRDPQLGDHHLLHQTESPCGLAQVSIVPGQGH